MMNAKKAEENLEKARKNVEKYNWANWDN
jgi:hypothetical protein